MKQMATSNFLSLIAAGHENRHIEWKQTFSWNDKNSIWLKEKVIRAMMGFANTPDGGYIIVGIKEGGGKGPRLNGLTAEELSSFVYDTIKDSVDGFSSSPIIFEIFFSIYKNKKFVIIRVEEFDELPVICKKNSQNRGVLKKGVIYCRSRGGSPKTIPVTETETRELIQRAVDKQQEILRRRGWRYRGAEVKNLFHKQREDFQ